MHSRAAHARDDSGGPFGPGREEAYARWRDAKLASYPAGAQDLVVEVRDPRSLSEAEAGEIRRICGRANMAVYASGLRDLADKEIARRLGEHLGLGSAIANPLADEDAISSIEQTPDKAGRGYIPYSSRRLLWHTDGYYNTPEDAVGAFLLHCVRPAAQGGENRLLDPEIAYILLREADPEHARALCAPDALTIPANETEEGMRRPARTGPVFSWRQGALHMRYTARVKSVEWRDDPATRAAAAALAALLAEGSGHPMAVRLEAGHGLVCNNVLHDRSAFKDPAGEPGRLIYRARYRRRIGAERRPVPVLALVP